MSRAALSKDSLTPLAPRRVIAKRSAAQKSATPSPGSPAGALVGALTPVGVTRTIAWSKESR